MQWALQGQGCDSAVQWKVQCRTVQFRATNWYCIVGQSEILNPHTWTDFIHLNLSCQSARSKKWNLTKRIFKSISSEMAGLALSMFATAIPAVLNTVHDGDYLIVFIFSVSSRSRNSYDMYVIHWQSMKWRQRSSGATKITTGISILCSILNVSKHT